MTKDVFAKLSLRHPKNFEQARSNMIKQQIRTWDVLNDQILALFYKVHREDFVPKAYRELAFADISIPLPNNQAMMPPKEEARILQDLHISHQDKILVIGAESGFLIALLSRLGSEIYFVCDDLDIFENVKQKVSDHKLSNVIMIIGSIHQGWQDNIPFDVMVLTGSLPTIPEELKDALALQGRLFVVVGPSPVMEAMIVQRLSEDIWREDKIFETNRPRMLGVKDSDAFVF